ncbi:MAG: hypothetical protein WBK54_04945 [Bacilli bacterium]
MKEVTSEKLDIVENASEEKEEQASETSQAKSTKKTGSKKTKKDPEAEMMDALERVRQEERAKLEALQAREREKTRQMVEKERAKLEAELEKEIKALEAQLAKEMAKAEITDPVPSLSLREEKPEVPKRTRKKAAAKPATKVPAEKEVVQTAVAIDLGDQPVPEAAASEAKVPAKAPAEVPVPAESMEAAQESAALSETAFADAVSADVEPGAAEVPAEVTETVAVAPQEGADAVSADLKPGAAEIPAEVTETVAVAPQEGADAVSADLKPGAAEIPAEVTETVAVAPQAGTDVPLEKAEISAEIAAPATAEKDAGTVINSLEKLREKVFAQKQLERELLEKEATRIQEKDRQLLEKINLVYEELQQEELQGTQTQIDSLLEESEKLRRRIDELEAIVNKVKALKLNDISVIDEKTFELTKEFTVYASDSASVNKLIKDIEAELESLTEEHQKSLAKLREAEAAKDQFYAQLLKLESENKANQQEIKRLRTELENKEKLYYSQISNLNNQILKAEERLKEERDNIRSVLMEIETLKFEKQKLMNENTGLKAEIEMLKDKLEKRLESSIDVAARIDLLEAEKSLLENKILQLNKQLIHKERMKPEGRADDPYSDLLSEIRRLKQDVEELKTRQFPFFMPDFSAYSGAEKNCPYVRFFNPMLIPNLTPQPQPLNEELVREVRELKKEFENFKQGKSSDEDGADNGEKQRLEEYSRKLEEYREELERNKAELNLLAERKDKEIAKITQDFETQMQAKDKEKNMIKAEKEKKIQELQQKIREKDALIEKINQEVKRLTEEDIFDPEFKRKIRVIRDMRRECEEKAVKMEEEHLHNVKAVKEKIDGKNLEIDVINDRIFQLEMSFRQAGDYSSAAQEEYEKSKSKLLLERGLHEEKLRELEEDMKRLESKYEDFLKGNAEEIEKLNNQEAETIEFYLNKLRRSRAKQLEGFQNPESEKQELLDQLDRLKEEPESNPDEIEVDMPFVAPQEDKSSDLENEIEELTRQYSVYYSQITELKAEQDKRVEAEKRLRMNDRNVYDYCSSKVNLEECLKAYQEKSLLAEEKENELSRTGDRSAQLKLKAELQDLEVHRNDLRAKIDFYRKQIQEFERADIVQKYQSLLMQIEKINNILREKREKAQEIKALVQAKTRELEMLRG